MKNKCEVLDDKNEVSIQRFCGQPFLVIKDTLDIDCWVGLDAKAWKNLKAFMKKHEKELK